MDTLTIIVSGPGGFETQARRALVDVGLTPHDKCVDHGLPDTVSGDTDASVSFVSLEGDDVDAAHKAVASLGWGLRTHYPPPMKTAPLIAEQEAGHEETVRRIVREELARMGR